MLQWFSGHGWWQRHLYLAGLTESPDCRLCGEDQETPEHIFECCPALTEVRAKVFGTSFPPYEGWSLAKMLDFILSDVIRSLVDLQQTLDVNAKV